MTCLRLCSRLIFVTAICLHTGQASQQTWHMSRQLTNMPSPRSENAHSADPIAGVGAQVANASHITPAAPADSSQADASLLYFAICVAAKDQHADINEWVEHHGKLGASKIYVYDDNSNPPMHAQLESYIQSGLVEYHFIEQGNHTSISRPQLWVYNECINQYRTRHHFMGFIDVDEFLFLRNQSVVSMPALLRQYEAYGGLAVNWVLFGSSGHVRRPEGGTLANYWKCVPQSHPENLHVKTIANMRYVAHASGTPHFFFYNENKTAVDENFAVVDGARTGKNVIERVALYHYVTKSKEEFKSKTARGSGMKNFKPEGFFEAIQAMAVDDCRDGMQWAKHKHHAL